MAEPLILAYGRGELPEFPASADTIVDIVPVDHVVSAIVAVLASPPSGRRAGVLPRLLGRSQPAHVPRALRQRARLLRRAPVRGRRARCGPAPGLAVPGRAGGRTAAHHERAGAQGGRLPRRPRAAERPHPRPGPQARPAGTTAGVPPALPRPLPGVRPGGAAVLRRQHARAVPTPSTPRTASGSPSTPPSSTGSTTCKRCTARRSPSRSARWTRSGGRGSGPPAGELKQVRARARSGVAAFFDMDGTLLSSNVIETYLWMRLRELSGGQTVRRARADRGPGAGPGAGRAEGAQRVPALGLPRVRRRPARRPRRGRGRRARRPRALAPRAGRRTPDPGAPRRRAPDGPDHRRDPPADEAAAPALRPHRGRRPGRRRPRRVHRPPRGVAAGGGVPGGVDAAVGRSTTASTWRGPTGTPTRTPTCPCWRRSGSRCRCDPTCRCSATPGGTGGRSSTGPARAPPPAPSTRQVTADDARARDVPLAAAACRPDARSGAGCPASSPASRRRSGW